MKRYVVCFLLSTFVILSAVDGALAADSPAIHLVAIKEGAVVVGDDISKTKDITGAGAGRSLPLWSMNGERIAFVQTGDRAKALADLVVINALGVEQARVAIQPVRPGMGYAGMRAVESIQWLSADKIVVQGSINPSQSQYYMVDVRAGQVIGDYIDDASSASFAPNGVHYVALIDRPHFLAREGETAGSVTIDERVVLELGGRGLEVASNFVWSSDGKSVAFLAQDVAKTSSFVFSWRDGVLHQEVVSLRPDDVASMFWDGKAFVLTAAGPGQINARSWSIEPESLTMSPSSPSRAIDPASKAELVREKWVSMARGQGLLQADVWCDECALRSLPRRTH